MSFGDLGVIASIIHVLQEKGYRNPTPIQQQVIPTLLSGHNMIASAQTDTRKTAGRLDDALSFCDNNERAQVNHLHRISHRHIQIMNHSL